MFVYLYPDLVHEEFVVPQGSHVIKAHLLAYLCSDKKNEKGLRKQEVHPGKYYGEQNPKGPAWLWQDPCNLAPNLLNLPFTSFSANRLVAGTLFKKCITD